MVTLTINLFEIYIYFLKNLFIIYFPLYIRNLEVNINIFICHLHQIVILILPTKNQFNFICIRKKKEFAHFYLIYNL